MAARARTVPHVHHRRRRPLRHSLGQQLPLDHPCYASSWHLSDIVPHLPVQPGCKGSVPGPLQVVPLATGLARGVLLELAEPEVSPPFACPF